MKNKVWLLITFLLMGCSNGNSVSTNNISSSSSTNNEISSSIFQPQIYLLEEINLNIKLTSEGFNYYLNEVFEHNDLGGNSEDEIFKSSDELLNYFNSNEHFEKIDESIFEDYKNLFEEYNVYYKIVDISGGKRYKCEFIDNLNEGVFRFTLGPYSDSEDLTIHMYFGRIKKSLMDSKKISYEYHIIDRRIDF